MKSIKQQYIDLCEGNMSQANFMRNLRMTLPQYVTNVTSFDDSVRILKNKGILTEADVRGMDDDLPAIYRMYNSDAWVDAQKDAGDSDYEDEYDPGPGEDENFERDYDTDYEEPNEPFDMAESLNEAKDEKGKWTNTDGKSMYGQFDEINIVNSQELLIGIDYEMVKNCDLSKEKATKIAIKKIKQVPNYYTMAGLAGVEGAEPEYIGGKSANPEAHQMQFLDKNMGNVVDKKRGMQSVKDVEKFKKDSTTGGETNKVVKGVETTSFIAKTVRGVQKMNATGEKMKKIAMKEARLNDFPGETPGKIAQQIATYVDSNPTLKQYSDEITLQSNPDGFLKYGYWESLPGDAFKALSLQFNIERDSHEDEDTGTLNFYRLTPKHSAGGVNLNKVDLMNMIREEIKEITGAYSGDAMSAEDGSSYM